uniref:Large ribosomal subunit protein uL3c n=1 Tax=Nitzschia sp. IriIs04 TaxID=1444690 RepID=A0A0S3QPP6_9STRA|nr:ribosomal protein L3 [Nitzschia sp. IriIs04]BAT70311.1 ribosomal protein L3 [Nitzschia sp. IriIs04]
MTHLYDKFGFINPITILKIGPCIITNIKSIHKSNNILIQIGYKEILNNNLTKSKLGQFKKFKIKPLKYLKEFSIKKNINNFKIGQLLTLNNLSIGQSLNVTSQSSGKGFSGLQKKHQFKLGPKTHGSKNYRKPGSIGMGTTPGRVLPGKKMSGQLGNKSVTVQNLKVIKIELQKNLLFLKGSVPGKFGTLLSISANN